jgi:hypothetical protein
MRHPARLPSSVSGIRVGGDTGDVCRDSSRRAPDAFPSHPPVNQRTRLRFQPATSSASPWPQVPAFVALDPQISRFLSATPDDQASSLERLRSDARAHARFLHAGLAQLNAYYYGYRDSCLHLKRERVLEAKLTTAKLVLEDEMLDHWLGIEPLPHESDDSPTEWLESLRSRVSFNAGHEHPLFDYLATRAGAAAMQQFLVQEVVRNEVVDDEVAWLSIGKQRAVKAACALNFADECGVTSGRAAPSAVHTQWLRDIVLSLGATKFDQLRASLPWHVSITSNAFNALLTRPALRLAAYGHFVTTEAWVQPHFERVLTGLERLGLDSCRRYFALHARIDPHHAEELLDALELDLESLTPAERASIRAGAEIAIASALESYDLCMAHLMASEVRS